MKLRLAVVLLCAMALPCAAWEAKSGAICILEHTEADGAMRLTYDPVIPEYSITVTLPDGSWTPAPVFSMSFIGARALTITTDRQGLNGSDLTVRDSGFGNVLNGLQFNDTAVAALGAQSVSVSLNGAAPEVQKFRDCTQAPSV